MKKILLLLTTLFILASCSIDDEPQQDFYVDFLPMEIVHMPQYVQTGKPCEIRVRYQKPNGCHVFERFHTETEGNAILIAVQTVVKPDAECLNATKLEPEERSFTFTPSELYNSGVYILKFLKGVDNNGNRTYTQVEMRVR